MRARTEKPTLQLDPTVIAAGPKVMVAAEELARIGGSLRSDGEGHWVVEYPEDRAAEGRAIVERVVNDR